MVKVCGFDFGFLGKVSTKREWFLFYFYCCCCCCCCYFSIIFLIFFLSFSLFISYFSGSKWVSKGVFEGIDVVSRFRLDRGERRGMLKLRLGYLNVRGSSEVGRNCRGIGGILMERESVTWVIWIYWNCNITTGLFIYNKTNTKSNLMVWWVIAWGCRRG